MKLFCYVILGLLMFLSFTIVDTTQASTDALFDIKTTNVYRLDKYDPLTHFEVQPVGIIGNEIAYWKVRAICKDKLTIAIQNGKLEKCGRSTTIMNSDQNKFTIHLDNGTNNKKVAFTIKVTAYDKEGNWLHSEKESFKWR